MGGAAPLSAPCSLALVALNGIAATMSPVCCAFSSAGSALASAGVDDGALSVLRAAALGAESPLRPAPRFVFVSEGWGFVGMLRSLVS